MRLWNVATSWEPYQPSADEPWDRVRVARLHRRAGFGATWAEIERDVAEGHEASLARLLEGSPTAPDGRPAGVVENFLEAMEQSFAGIHGSVDPLRLCWMRRMWLSAWPLREKMLLAWHDHYATSESKVFARELLAVQHRTQRQHWRDPIGRLHAAMLADHAMLVWLDGVDSSRTAPNENLAREFFELFALGLGNYSEADVREAARALTGWRLAIDDQGAIRYDRALFDSGEKQLFGERGPWDAGDLVRLTCAQPAAARHVAERLWRTFVSDRDPPAPELLEELAARMRVDGDVDVRRGLATLLTSRLFHSEAYAGRRVLGPVEWLVTSLRSLALFPPHPDPAACLVHAEQIGQRLFAPPSVDGWPRGLGWLSVAGLVARTNFAAWLTSSEAGLGPDDWAAHPAAAGIRELNEVLDYWTLLCWGAPAAAEVRARLAAHYVRGGEVEHARLVAALLGAAPAQVA